jgi:hypothetical protein
MKNIAILFILSITLLSSCANHSRNPVDKFEISKYKGFKMIDKKSRNSFEDFYVLRNDTIAIEVVVSKHFDILYNVGDTIK